MPIYDYICGKCGHQMEVIHSVHGEGPSGCPKCGGQMRKALVAPAVHFKGSGWARKERSGSASRSSTSTSTSDSESSSDASGSAEKSSPGSEPAKPAEPSAPASTSGD